MILVIGGCGYVGSVLVKRLIFYDHKVRVLDPLWFGNHLDIPIDLVVDDINTCDMSVLDGINRVVHLGGFSNDPTAEHDPELHYKVNVLGTKRIATLCKEARVRRFVFASTASIYDRGTAERYDRICCEDDPVYPVVPYSSSKYEAERILLSMADVDFSPVILRKGTVYGPSPRMRYDLVVNAFARDIATKRTITLYGGGEVWRPLVSVDDAARAYTSALFDDRAHAQIINISGGNYRISELALRIQKMFPGIKIHADYAPRPLRSYRMSTDKAWHVLRWVPRQTPENIIHTLVEGVKDADNPIYYNIQWMKRNES